MVKLQVQKNAIKFDGKEVDLIKIETKNVDFTFMSYGATILSIKMADINEIKEEILATYNDLNDFYKTPAYFGMTIGPTSGRIEHGECIIDGKQYNFDKNWNNLAHLHGGQKGISHKVWDYEINEANNKVQVIFKTTTNDDYPGNLDIKITYEVNEDGNLLLKQEATTNKTTLCNLTNHAYFNLSGNLKCGIDKQYLKLKANKYLEVNKNLVPEKSLNVANTPFDFSKTKLIGKDIAKVQEDNEVANGYDHAWILENEPAQILMFDKESKRKMEVSTNYPCVVCYSQNFPTNKMMNVGIKDYYNASITFECQLEPNGINKTFINSGLLHEDEKYDYYVLYKFTIER